MKFTTSWVQCVSLPEKWQCDSIRLSTVQQSRRYDTSDTFSKFWSCLLLQYTLYFQCIVHFALCVTISIPIISTLGGKIERPNGIYSLCSAVIGYKRKTYFECITRAMYDRSVDRLMPFNQFTSNIVFKSHVANIHSHKICKRTIGDTDGVVTYFQVFGVCIHILVGAS